ncbi:LamG domain-containing protein [Planctomycetales bacterium ZRK34]|nr:LamG domain-containing protein [Planctomycetales bacterium ZRK34]
MSMNRLDSPSRRAGSAYVLVLATSMIVTVIGISALTAVRLRLRAAELDRSVSAAELHARSAVEMGLFWIGNDADWRTNHPNGVWETNRTVGRGTYTLQVTDPTDSDLTNSWVDPVVVRGTGYDGRARAIYEVTLDPDPAGARPIRAATLALSPSNYWPLQEAAGTAATDLAGDVSGVYTNGVTLNSYDSHFAEATARFDGGNDYVAIPHRNAFLMSAGSVSLWFKPNSASGTQGLFSKDAYGIVTGGHMTIYIESGRLKVRLQSLLSSYTITSASGSVTAGDWHHAVFNFGSDGMKLYLNGEQVSSSSYTGGLYTVFSFFNIVKNEEPIALGVSTISSLTGSLSGWSNPFGGRLAHVAMFNYALSSDQIKTLYDAGNPTRTMRPRPGSLKKVVE